VIKYLELRYDNQHQCSSMEEVQSVIDVATKRQDEPLVTILRDEDLLACEVQYHPVCRKIYASDPSVWRSTDRENIESQAALEETQELALQKVTSFVDDAIIQRHQITKLSYRWLLYLC
jgi:hypothetical protein